MSGHIKTILLEFFFVLIFVSCVCDTLVKKCLNSTNCRRAWRRKVPKGLILGKFVFFVTRPENLAPNDEINFLSGPSKGSLLKKF